MNLMEILQLMEKLRRYDLSSYISKFMANGNIDAKEIASVLHKLVMIGFEVSGNIDFQADTVEQADALTRLILRDMGNGQV